MAPRTREKLQGMAISDLSIRAPVFITMLMVLTIVFGLLSFRALPVNFLPDFEVPVVVVSVSYPGAGPESVAEQVIKPIEDQVNTINNLKHITSTANEGLAIIALEFNDGTNVERADRDVREKVDAIRNSLPRDVREPVYQRFDPNAAPILTIAVADDGTRSPLELRRLVDDTIVPRLQRAGGVGSATVTGGQERQINVNMDLSKLTAYQILPAQLVRSLQAANANTGLGTITSGDADISLRAPSLLTSAADIGKIQITGTNYRVSDVATIEDGVVASTSYARLDGNNTILIAVRKQSGTNTVSVADAVKTQLASVFTGLPGVRYVIPNDQSTAVSESTISSIEELIFASVAALLVVMFFFSGLRKTLTTSLVPALIVLLGFVVLPAFGISVNPIIPLAVAVILLIVLTFFRDRNTLVTMAGLPIIIIGTFAFMPLFGLTINVITLLALSLCVGLVIDDAIVVRENIFRHTERGESPRIAASRGTAEVALSVIAMTFTIVAVFVPVTFTTGTTGIIFKSFGITIAVAIMLSLVEAFMFAPMLSANLFQRKKGGHEKQHAPQEALKLNIDPDSPDANLAMEAAEDPGRVGRWYSRLLHASLKTIWTRLAVVAVAIAVLIGSFGVASQLKFSFFPQQDAGQFIVGYELPPGTSLDANDRIAQRVEAVLTADPDAKSVISSVGSGGSTERAEFTVNLDSGKKSPPAIERMRARLTDVPNLVFAQPGPGAGASTAVSGRTLQLGLATTRPLSEVAAIVNQVQNEIMPSTAGLVDIATNYRPGKTEVRFVADPTRIGDLGLTNDDIGASVRALINGERATVLRENGVDTDIVVRLREADRSSTQALQQIVIPTRSGPVPLSSLGTLEISNSPTTIRRYDRLNQVLIGANLENRNLAEAQAEIQQKLKAAQIPAGVTASFQGQAQQQGEGFGSLILAMALSVLFVYMVLASQFGSFTQPLVIMVAMPFAFIGAFLALLFTGTDLDITGMIGLITLLGLVVKNSILLVDFTNRLRAAGVEKNEAIALAGAVRLRPILMTSFALIVGALPVAMGIHLVGTGQGGEFRKGLATVLIGGLTTSMFLTLLVVPTVYSLMESVTERATRFWARRSGDHDEQPVTDAPTMDAPAGPVPAPTYAADGGMASSGNAMNSSDT